MVYIFSCDFHATCMVTIETVHNGDRCTANSKCSAAASLGYSKLKPTQQEVVEKFVSGRDVFVCLPTGSGKSLCYAVLPAVFDGLGQLTDKSLVIVVSPLIVLIKDQVETFTLKGLSCFYANSPIKRPNTLFSTFYVECSLAHQLNKQYSSQSQ